MNKHKIIVFLLAAFLILTMIPAVALAADTTPADGYNDHDYDAIKAFLNLPSATFEADGKTNAQQLGYTDTDPTTWTDITWNSDAEKRITDISWSSKNLAGALDLSGFTFLTNADLSINKLTSLNLGGDTALYSLRCSDNALTALDVSQNTSLLTFYCADNKLSSLDLSHNTGLRQLNCSNNTLHILDVSQSVGLSRLECSGNLLTQIDAMVTGALLDSVSEASLNTPSVPSVLISLTAVGNGYVELTQYNYVYAFEPDTQSAQPDGYAPSCKAKAVPIAPSAFKNWTSAGTQVSADVEYSLTVGTAYDLNANFDCSVGFDKNGGDTDAVPASVFAALGAKITAPVTPPTRANYDFDGWYKETACTNAWNFDTDTVSDNMTLYAKWAPKLTASVSSGTIYKGGRITLTPSLPGGTWSFDSTYLSRTDNTFKGLKAGTTTVTYTLGSDTATFDITISAAGLPNTGQDFTLVWVFSAIAIVAAVFTIWYTTRKGRA